MGAAYRCPFIGAGSDLLVVNDFRYSLHQISGINLCAENFGYGAGLPMPIAHQILVGDLPQVSLVVAGREFDDSLPRIYEELTGKKYSDGTISKNKYFGATEAELLKEVCTELYPDEQLLAEMQRALLDTEAKAAAISNKRNVILNFEKEIKKAFYRDEADAEQIASTRALRISGIADEASPDDFVD